MQTIPHLLKTLFISSFLFACQSHPIVHRSSGGPSITKQQDLYTHKNAFFSPNTNASSFFHWPVRSSSRFKISQKYQPYRTSRKHLGIDIAGPKGSPIYASHSGRVIYSGRAFRGFGKMVLIQKLNSSWSSLYAHLDDIYVQNGQVIGKGQVVGTLGNTGKVTGPHLHFELRKDKKTVNPLRYLP